MCPVRVEINVAEVEMSVAVSAEPTASVRIACRRLTKQDAEVTEIKRDDDEYDEIMRTAPVKTTPDPSDNKVVKVKRPSFSSAPIAPERWLCLLT